MPKSHNSEVAGSNPAPATMKTHLLIFYLFLDIYVLCNVKFS